FSDLPEIQRMSNRYVEFQYYDTLAELKIQSGNFPEGKNFLTAAIQIADDGLQSLPTWRERLTWTEQHRWPYTALAEVLLRSGNQVSALEVWEHFRVADDFPVFGEFHAGRRTQSAGVAPESVPGHPSSETRIVTYAFGRDGLMIWI